MILGLLAGEALLVLALAPAVGYYFALGRFSCPARERLALSEMTAVEIAATVRRGFDRSARHRG
ncbi:hypothetical protein [Brevibacterium luteolum]|uniref:Uncharacterized protein n=1 Tax=Brevibacterium luteolum TaxID=199591 RepID=A0A6G8KXR5_9MICO|nr:hypothetical protein [Brevibacterium luteolum]QIN29604.1 hypothetical protein EW640_10180 [Brevibacterium luteolum]